MAHLCITCRRANYDAVARVLGDRDHWLAQAVAALAKQVEELGQRGANDEWEEGEFCPDVADRDKGRRRGRLWADRGVPRVGAIS